MPSWKWYKYDSHEVVVEDLAPGEYTLNFLIPNKDAFYEEPLERIFTVKSGEIVKIDQHFQPLEVAFYDSKPCMIGWRGSYSFQIYLRMK